MTDGWPFVQYFEIQFVGELTPSATRAAERIGVNNNPSDSHFGGNRIESNTRPES